MAKQRPSVDEHSWDLAEFFLECQDGFNSLREDIRTDLKWELAGSIQTHVEDWLHFQFPQSLEQRQRTRTASGD